MLNFHLESPLSDAEISAAIGREFARQADQIELIASENIVSADVLKAQGSVLTNKYAEGYPGRRYSGGCEFVDEVETLAIERAKALFGAGFANVQPHSGAQANQSVFLALLQPGDRIMGMSLAHGGHLTHGSPVTMSGRWFDVVSYEVRESGQLIDYDAIRAKARETHPKLIIAGASAYPRAIDFAAFRSIADEVGAMRMVDMAHYAGLVAASLLPRPAAARPRGHHHDAQDAARPPRRHHPDRRPRAGEEVQLGGLPRQPGRPAHARHRRQDGGLRRGAPARVPHSCGRGDRQRQDARAHAGRGRLRLPYGPGRPAAEGCHRTRRGARPGGGRPDLQENAIPFDPEKPAVTSGVRLGTSAGTTRGFDEAEFRRIGEMILTVVNALASAGPDGDPAVEAAVLEEVQAPCRRFPIYR